MRVNKKSHSYDVQSTNKKNELIREELKEKAEEGLNKWDTDGNLHAIMAQKVAHLIKKK